MTLTIEVYEADNATLVDSIDPGQYRSASYREANSHVGGWSIALPNIVMGGEANPALDLLTTGRVVRFLVDDVVRGAGIVEDRNIVVVSPTEEGGEVTTVSGRGLAGAFDKVRIRPDRGLNNLPHHPTRWFNFAADRLRDDDAEGPQGVWPGAYGQLPNYDTDNYFGRPEGFVDTAGPDGDGPEWLWEDDTRTGFADAGVVYFRQRFTLDADGPVEIQFAADDEGELWIDDVPVCRAEGVYLGGCVKATVRLSAGEHLIAALGRNLNALRAGVVYAGWTVTNGMPDTLVFRSDASLALCLPYPADPPGFTPTEVIRLVVDEVQDLTDGRLEQVTFSFISASDTDSAEVDEVTDITCKAPADSILTFLEMLGETYLDWSVTPDSWELNAWIRGTRGSDLSASVEFEKGTCRRVTHDESGSERATIALVEGDNFAPFDVVHADAAILGVYEEVALSFGEASAATAEKFAIEFLNDCSQSRKGLTIELVPGVGPVPYEDFGIGDTITVPGIDGTPSTHRVMAIGLELNADSVIRWTVDLDQPRTLLQERLGALMRRQMPGSAGGRTLLPSPVNPSFPSNTSGTEKTETWSAPVQGTVVLTKNGTPITGATLSGDGQVTLTDAAREFVYGSDLIDIEIDGVAGFDAPFKPPSGRWLMSMAVTEGADGTTVTVTYT